MAEGDQISHRETDNREIDRSGSRWATVVWPSWLPVRARLPFVAQITGAAALIAAITMPRWADVPPKPAPAPATERTTVTAGPTRPAHLNLDVRHTFRRADVTVTVDDKRVLSTRLDGGGRKFGMFGKRPERGLTRTLDLEPGVRVVRVRVQSPDDRYDHSRVERFELGSAAVAAMRVTADTSGLTVVTEKAAAAATSSPPPLTPASAAASPAPATASTGPTESGVLYQTLRSILIALAGFIASAATGYVVQEFLRTRRKLIFAEAAEAVEAAAAARPRRRRPRKSPNVSATS